MTARTSGTGTCLTAKSLDISLAALRRQDPYINNIVDVASQVALYTFSNRANEWEKTDVEGTLFVYTRLASPRHGFTIMNRLSMENLTEPITKDLDFQLQDPFLLYRNARLSIYGIWFYDKEDCQRIAELMKNLTRQEQLLAQQGAGVSPGDSKGVDILQMLTKARDEYDKGKPSSEPKEIVCSSVIHDNPNLIKPIPVKPLERQPGPQQSVQDSDQKPKQLSLAALFGGTSQPKPVSPQAESGGGRGGGLRPAVARSLSYEEASQTAVARPAAGSPPQPCPAIQKLMNVQRGPAELLQPVPESPENHPCENGGRPLAHHCQGRNTLQGLFHSSAPTCHSLPPPPHHPLLHCPQVAQSDLGQSLGFGRAHVQTQPLFFSPSKPQLVPPSQPSQVSPHELLQRLQLVQKEQGLSGEPARPVLAPRFQEPPLPPVRQLDSWADKTSASPVVASSHKPSPLYQVISPQRIPATVAPSLLLSPMVFTQAKSAKSGVEPRPPAAPLLTPKVPEEPRALTKSQLQATLLHLIQNDAAFLETIYETYISCSARDSTAKHF